MKLNGAATKSIILFKEFVANMDKLKIQRSFGGAAETYDRYANVQKIASNHLVLAAETLAAPTSICEIGCGTGYLSSTLLKKYGSVPYLATDISNEMLSVCQDALSKFQAEDISFAKMDGENFYTDLYFDWIVSNFTFQWFSTQLQSIKKLRDKANYLIFTTLLEGTFIEWKQVCADLRLNDKVLSFLKEDQFYAEMSKLTPQYLQIEDIQEDHANILAFLQSVKGIGAHYGNSENKRNFPLMRQLAKNDAPFSVSYRVGYCILHNDKLGV
jgi:malonyl-CoA O-methyltransferase